MLHGVLNIKKPGGVTSRWVVDQVQRLVRPAKAGHAGTLDPLATGVLVVCVGQATRLIEYVQRGRKRYTGTFLLGRSSPTEDVESEVALLVDPPIPSREGLTQAAEALVGTIEQRPPAYSALKVEGRRAYDLARAGEEVKLAPRQIDIHRLEIVSYEYPELTLEIECGGGTYVRSLGRDLARALGSDAVMSALVRTAIGGFRLDDSIDVEQLTRTNVAESLLPPLAAVGELPALELSAEEIKRITHGLSIRRPTPSAEDEWAALDSAGRLLAILARRPDGALGPSRVFPPA